MERGVRPGGMMMMMRPGAYGSASGAMGALRGTRELYDPYRQLHRAGPSAWVPATLLGVVLLITTMPHMRAPEMAYYNRAVRASSFPLPMLWIPVAGFIALQFFGANDWYRGVYVGDRYGARPGFARGTSWPWSDWRQYHYRYNAHHHRGVVSTFMDFVGHWLLILLGVTVFTLVGSSSVSGVAAAPRVAPVVPLAPRMLGFPWSWFF